MSASSSQREQPYAPLGTEAAPDMRRKVEQLDNNVAELFHVRGSDDDMNRSITPNQIVCYWTKNHNGMYRNVGRKASNNRNFMFCIQSLNTLDPAEQLRNMAHLYVTLTVAGDKRYKDMACEIIGQCLKVMGIVTGNGQKATSARPSSSIADQPVGITHGGTYQVPTYTVLDKEKHRKIITTGMPLRFTIPKHSEWTQTNFFSELPYPEARGKLTMYVEPITPESNFKHLKTVVHGFLWGEPCITKKMLSDAITKDKEPLQPMLSFLDNLEAFVGMVALSAIHKGIACSAFSMINPLAFRDVYVKFNRAYNELKISPLRRAGDTTRMFGALNLAMTPEAVSMVIAAHTTAKAVLSPDHFRTEIPVGAASPFRLLAQSGATYSDPLSNHDLEIFTLYKIMAMFIRKNYPSAVWQNYASNLAPAEISRAGVTVDIIGLLKMADDDASLDLSWLETPSLAEISGTTPPKPQLTGHSEKTLNQMRELYGDEIFDFRDGLMCTTDISGTRPEAILKRSEMGSHDSPVFMFGSSLNRILATMNEQEQRHVTAENLAGILSTYCGHTVAQRPDGTRQHGHHYEGFMARMIDAKDAEIDHTAVETQTRLNFMFRTIARQVMGSLRIDQEIDKELSGYDWKTGRNELSKMWSGSRQVAIMNQDFGWFDHYMTETGPDFLMAVASYFAERDNRVEGIVISGGGSGARADVLIAE